MKSTGNDAGAGREKAVLEKNLWISSENDYYGTTFQFHLDSEEMVDCHPEIQVCIVPFKIFFRKFKEGKFGPKVAPKNFTPPKSVRFKITLFFIIHVTAFY